MKKLFVIIAFACTAILSLQAQVITWSVKPGVYTKIEPYWEDMYLCYTEINVGVINGDGRVIVSPEATRITGFYSGLALALKSVGGQERILGILSDDGSFSEVDGTYYTIPNQEFFSEGFLTVNTSGGGTGYMNVKGHVVKEYNVSFVSPFSEGYAVVGEGRASHNFCIVDKRFNELQISLPSMSPLWNGANVFKGVAIVWDGNGNIFEFNPQRGGPCSVVKDKSIKSMLKGCDYNPDYDYLGGLAKLTNRPETAPYKQPTRSSLALTVSEQGNKYGYIHNGKTILPCQFEQAESFYGNYAIVKSDGKYGLLSYHNTNDSFTANASSEIKYKKSSGKNLSHKFGITVPNLWVEDNLTVKVKDENGIPVSITNDGGSYEFKSDGAKGTKKYSVEIDGEGLILWTGEIAYNYQPEMDSPVIIDTQPRVKPFVVTLKATNTHADKNNRCYVKATISNPNSEAISAIVTMSGSNLLEAVSKRITIPAYGSEDISTYFIVKKATSGQKVTVSTSAGGSATLDGLQLIPF